MSSFPVQTLESIDALIGSGGGKKAIDLLNKLLTRKVPREYLVRVCWQLARCGMHSKALRILSPIVRSTSRTKVTATDDEKAMYSACLTGVGATQEAISLLAEITTKDLPRAILYHGHALVKQWDYRDAIPYFSQYVESQNITPYERAVGKANLAACLVHEQMHDEALVLLEELFKEVEKNSWLLLRGNLYDLAAENAINARDWKEAEGFLARAERDLASSGGLPLFFVQKYKSIVQVCKTDASAASLLQLAEIKKQAIEKMHWETVRECDRVLATETKDEALLRHLYFGTPYDSFREWMLKSFGGSLSFGDNYVWKLGKARKPEFKMDLLNGVWKKDQEPLKVGTLSHRILVALSSDFYKPFRIAPLHALLHPGVFFSPDSAAQKIHEGIRKFRIWAKSAKIPVEIEEIAGQYRLASASTIEIHVYRANSNADSQTFRVEQLRAKWPEEYFTITEVMELFDMSRRTAQRVLQSAVESGALIREGESSARKYRVVSTTDKKAA